MRVTLVEDFVLENHFSKLARKVPKHQQHEDVLRNVQQAPDGITIGLLIKPYWREVLFLMVLPKVGPS